MLQASVQGQSLAVAFLTPGYMSKLILGTSTEDLTTTLVRSGFRHLSLMAESPAVSAVDKEDLKCIQDYLCCCKEVIAVFFTVF